MEGLGTGTSLETLLQESQQHTILLSDIRENSEVSRKTDEKTLSQLQKLQQAASQTLEVAKAHKKQAKDESNTMKTMHEATVNANAIVAKRQTSVLNTLCRTVDVGLNVVNQKMFSAMEKLGSSIAGAFVSVGRSLENKLYTFMGSFSILVRPLVGMVKVGFSVLSKVISVPLKMIWEGLKAFSNTIIGKILMFAGTVYLMYQFFTKTNIGEKIAHYLHEKMNDPNSTLGNVLNTLKTISYIVGGIAAIIGARQVIGLGRDIYHVGKGVKGFFGRGGAAKIAPTVTTTDFSSMSKNDLRRYINANGGNVTKSAAGGMSREALAEKAASLGKTPTPTSTALKSAGKLGRVGGILSKGNLAGIVGGLALDYAADNVENRKLSGALNVGSAALSGAATGAMIGSIIPGLGTAIGGAIGGVLGAGASLFAGEGGEKLFGSSNEDNEVTKLNELQEEQAKASQAEIKSLDDIAEAIRDSNKTLTRVVEKMSTDAQQGIHRHEATTTEAARHEDAKTQQDLTVTTNKTLNDIKVALEELTKGIMSLMSSNRANPYTVKSNI